MDRASSPAPWFNDTRASTGPTEVRRSSIAPAPVPLTQWPSQREGAETPLAQDHTVTHDLDDEGAHGDLEEVEATHEAHPAHEAEAVDLEQSHHPTLLA